MSISTSGTKTEAQFEAQLRAAILRAFPWLMAEQITHQKSFSFRFGRTTITVDAAAKSLARGRADVLVFFRGKPLAVFELKRPGLVLTDDDEQQGLSYARMLHPRPPLVVVSNGNNTRLLETHSGEAWAPQTKSEAALADLIKRGARVAEVDLKRAVEILMGSDSDIWMRAIREVTARTIEDMTGTWNQPLAPFVRHFLLPRKVTHLAYHLLEERQRLVTLEGGPLAGKTSALRELAELTADHTALAVLYLDADAGLNLFERIALILSDALDWPITADEARRWLVNVSRANGPALVLAIDNVGLDRDDLRRDIETLTTNLFGPALRVVLAIDAVVAEQITRQRTGRGSSALGRRAKRLSLGPLDNDEFQVAEAHLSDHRLGFVQGARYSGELRTPWLIRAMAANAATSPEYKNENLVGAMSPVPGFDLIDHTRQAFDVSQASFARYRELARAILKDAQDRSRPLELILELHETFIVRRSTTLTYLDAEELRCC
jgi:hypothetical protein